MAVNKPRNRILIFRLTEDEYETLQAASSGARSLSEFARAKLLGSLNAPAQAIDEQLSELNTKITRIAELLERD
ncbi:MAG: hypothetical protein DMG59_16840 [Acidobacteria bacterium]|jgi:hypothetical protein|nr:MAG: hypothetical protein DMG59_16840 [Acidobacteriota bacterium]